MQPHKLIPLPPPYDDLSSLPPRKAVTAKGSVPVDTSRDGFSALGRDFRKRLRTKIVSLPHSCRVSTNSSTRQQLDVPEAASALARPLRLCQTCTEACPIYEASGHDEVYRPTFRSAVFRRGEAIRQDWRQDLGRLKGEDIELNAATICRLLESAYR